MFRGSRVSESRLEVMKDGFLPKIGTRLPATTLSMIGVDGVDIELTTSKNSLWMWPARVNLTMCWYLSIRALNLTPH